MCGIAYLIPPMPAVLTHGDLWPGNVVQHPDGSPALIDPAVSYMWAELDVSGLWCSTTLPQAAECFFPAYLEVAPLAEGWRERAPLLHLGELLSCIAHGIDIPIAAETVHDILAPHRPR